VVPDVSDLPATLPDCRDASAVILIRDSAAGPEVFLVQRHSKSKFMAGAFVFPGGKVDKADCELFGDVAGDEAPFGNLVERLDETPGTCLTRERSVGFGVAACRELLEEAQVSLGRDRLSSEAVASLHYYAHWVTPSFEKRRFDTRFFVAMMPRDEHAQHDDHECVASRWVSFRDALGQQAEGKLNLPPPTLKIISELSRFENCSDLLEYASGVVVEAWMPKAVEGGSAGDFSILLPWDSGYAEAIGDSLPLRNPSEAEARSPGVTRLELVEGRWAMLGMG